MEWLIILIIMIISTILQVIANYLKCKKEDVEEITTKGTDGLSDLDKLEGYGISPKLRKAVEALINETKNVDAQTYAKKIASNCFGCPSEKIKSNDPFGSISDIPATPFYTYLPVPFQPVSRMFLAVSTGSINTYICLLKTGISLPSSNQGAAVNALSDKIYGDIYIMTFLEGTNITTIKESDSVKFLSTSIQTVWNGLIKNGDLGGWVAYSNMIIENPFYVEQDALNYFFTGIGYYASIERALVINDNKLYKLKPDYITHLTGWFKFEDIMCLTFDRLYMSTGNEITI